MPAAVAVIAFALDLLVALRGTWRSLTPPSLGVDGALVDQPLGLLNRRLVHLVSGHAAGPTRWRPPRTAEIKKGTPGWRSPPPQTGRSCSGRPAMRHPSTRRTSRSRGSSRHDSPN